MIRRVAWLPYVAAAALLQTALGAAFDSSRAAAESRMCSYLQPLKERSA